MNSYSILKVLSDLPPKIIQDISCTLSHVQRRLYDESSGGQPTDALGSDPKEKHVFALLQYQRAICNHPSLVLNDQHPLQKEMAAYFKSNRTNIHDIIHSGKMAALHQLLLDCGLTGDDQPNDAMLDAELRTPLNPHRILLFAQKKIMLNLIVADVLQRHMSYIKFLRLDGDVKPHDRQAVV